MMVKSIGSVIDEYRRDFKGIRRCCVGWLRVVVEVKVLAKVNGSEKTEFQRSELKENRHGHL